ncbi:MAG: hypothetical protein QGG09_01695, partial [Pirellulaceae bacterium]|nr:hypothetical protein [Pirellulaceae bacterium]
GRLRNRRTLERTVRLEDFAVGSSSRYGSPGLASNTARPGIVVTSPNSVNLADQSHLVPCVASS